MDKQKSHLDTTRIWFRCMTNSTLGIAARMQLYSIYLRNCDAPTCDAACCWQRSAQLQGFPVVYFRKNGIPSFTTTTKALLSYRHSTTLLFHVLNDSKQSAQVTITQLSHIQKLSPEIHNIIQQPSTNKEQK